MTARERPSEAEIAAWVADARRPALAHAVPRRWWRVRRSLVVGAVVGAVGAGGLAYAAVERARTSEAPEPPRTVKGDSVVQIGRPGPEDKWLNLSVWFRCEKGERISISSGGHEFMESGCPKNGTVSYGDRGMSGSKPIGEIRSTELVIRSTLSHQAAIEAAFGPRPVVPQFRGLPPEGPDSSLQWDLPTYPVNEYGLTVGSRITINTPDSAWPDLIPTTYRGKIAYFRTADTQGLAGTLEEARRQTRERREQGLDVGKKRYQWVYAADGRTRLGKIRVN
jgi:hypothetical protein